MQKASRVATEVFEWYESILLAFLAVILIFFLVGRAVGVSGESMYPTLDDGNQLFVQTLTSKPTYGDIVVADNYTGYGDPIIKRLIGMPGDVIDLDPVTNRVIRNGEVLDEPYLSVPTYPEDVPFPITVPVGKVLLMGDNRTNSLDSSSSQVGCIDQRALLGKVVLRFSPFEKIGG